MRCPSGALLQSRGFVSSCFCRHSARRGFDTPRALPPLFWRVLDRLDYSAITSDGGLLAYRELDDVLALTTAGGEILADARLHYDAIQAAMKGVFHELGLAA